MMFCRCQNDWHVIDFIMVKWLLNDKTETHQIVSSLAIF